MFLDVAFDRCAALLDRRDRRWARECVFGTLRHRGRIDHLLDHHVHKGIASLDRPVLDVLRLGAYQLLRMAVPDYAAVAQSVQQTRAIAGPGAAGLANGVLRSVARTGEDETLFPDRARDPAGYLAAWHSHPRWLVERWLGRENGAAVERLLRSNNRVPAVYLRPLGSTSADAAVALGADAEDRPYDLCVEIPGDLPTAEALNRVRGIVQDPAAALVTRYADIARGSLVADLCAAPGGKAMALAEDARFVLASDRSRSRLARVLETRDRLESPVGVVAAFAETPPLRGADVVLVDVPCSGTGTLRRSPDLKWRLRPESIDSLAHLQRAILKGAATSVSPGGLLVYATCTLEPEENEQQVDEFLRRNPNFEMEPSARVDASLLDASGALRVDPRQGNHDGAFAARMRRLR